MSSEDYDMSFKVMMLGESGVGKSSIVQRYVNDTFDEDANPTVGTDFARKIVKTGDGHRVNMMVWDTAGQERFLSLTTSFYRGVHAFLVCYDVSDPKSLQRIPFWLEEIKAHATLPDALRALVANKIDLRTGDNQDGFITRAEGAEFARENGMLFFECSALTRVGIQQAFEEVLLKIIEEPVLSKDGTVAQKEGSIEVKRADNSTNGAADGGVCYC